MAAAVPGNSRATGAATGRGPRLDSVPDATGELGGRLGGVNIPTGCSFGSCWLLLLPPPPPPLVAPPPPPPPPVALLVSLAPNGLNGIAVDGGGALRVGEARMFVGSEKTGLGGGATVIVHWLTLPDTMVSSCACVRP